MKRLLLIAITLIALLAPATVSAATDPLKDVCTGSSSSATACGARNQTLYGPNSVLKRVTLVIALIGGIAAVIIMLVGSFQFVTAGGDPQKVASARSIIVGALIGLVIITAAEAIITFVLNKI